MNLENKYRMYMQLQKEKYKRNVLVSAEELMEKLKTLAPGEMLSVAVLEGEDGDVGR